MTHKTPTLIINLNMLETVIGQAGEFNHFFGGPNDLQVLGFPEGQPMLHRVLNLDLNDPQINFALAGIQQLPLLYGFVFNGCEVQYRVLSDGVIQIEHLTPSSALPDWPYSEYPVDFARVPIQITGVQVADEETIDALTWWMFEPSKSNELWVNVPPNPQFGVSLWGPEGDAEGVELVFRIDPDTKTVTVRNECS